MTNKILESLSKHLGVSVVKNKKLDKLTKSKNDALSLLDTIISSGIIKGTSHAQLHQDVMALLNSNFKENGFFVEFGATNGVELSNTHLLEKCYNWTGILAEPAKVWHPDLEKNRNASIDHSCVWKKTGDTLKFDMVDEAEFSTISEFSDSDKHAESRKESVQYDVSTISLLDLLQKHQAPEKIDYLSIDTEGSEYEILRHFDFDQYDISFITCEHNFTENRDKILELLEKNGFVRRFTSLSRWDDWFFKETT